MNLCASTGMWCVKNCVIVHNIIISAVSAVSCSLGMDPPTVVVSNGAVLHLRRRETLILNCNGDPVGNGEHLSIRDGYPGTTGVIRRNERLLNYTWYIEATADGHVRIYRFDRNGGQKMVFELTIHVHDLSPPTEMPTSGPCTTPGHEQTSLPTDDQVSPPDVDSEIQQQSDTSTTGAGSKKTATTNAVEIYAPYAVAGVLIILIVVILVLFLVFIIKGRRRKVLSAVDGRITPVRFNHECENGEVPSSSDTSSNPDPEESPVLDTPSASSNSGQDVFNEHDVSTHQLTP